MELAVQNSRRGNSKAALRRDLEIKRLRERREFVKRRAYIPFCLEVLCVCSALTLETHAPIGAGGGGRLLASCKTVSVLTPSLPPCLPGQVLSLLPFSIRLSFLLEACPLPTFSLCRGRALEDAGLDPLPSGIFQSPPSVPPTRRPDGRLPARTLEEVLSKSRMSCGGQRESGQEGATTLPQRRAALHASTTGPRDTLPARRGALGQNVQEQRISENFLCDVNKLFFFPLFFFQQCILWHPYVPYLSVCLILRPRALLNIRTGNHS